MGFFFFFVQLSSCQQQNICSIWWEPQRPLDNSKGKGHEFMLDFIFKKIVLLELSSKNWYVSNMIAEGNRDNTNFSSFLFQTYM